MSNRVRITEGLDLNDHIGLYNRLRKGYFIYRGKVIKVKVFPNGFWNKEVAKELARYFILDELGWNREDICEKFTNSVFSKNQLRGVLKQYGSHTYEMISDIFPEFDIKPWELKFCPNGFWKSKDNCKEVTIWLAQKEGIDPEIDKAQFAKTISVALYEKYGLGKAVSAMGGLYGIVNITYPGKYKPWDLNKIGIITDEIIVMATKWLIEEQLHWSFEDVCNNLTAQIFYDYNLGGILCKGCGHSPIIALQKTYPGVYTKDMLLKGVNHPFRKPKSKDSK